MNTLYLQFLILIIAGWVNRSQQDVIEYLQAALLHGAAMIKVVPSIDEDQAIG